MLYRNQSVSINFLVLLEVMKIFLLNFTNVHEMTHSNTLLKVVSENNIFFYRKVKISFVFSRFMYKDQYMVIELFDVNLI